MYKNFKPMHYALGLLGLFVTVYVARKGWEKGGESSDTSSFSAKRQA